MRKLIVFEDEAMEIVREADRNRKAIVLGTQTYEKRTTDYDGYYVSEWKRIEARLTIGFNNKEMAEEIYSFCNQNRIEPILK